ETIPPGPTAVFKRLASYEIPTAKDWTDSLFEQWQWVRKTVEEPQEFFRLTEDQARERLGELGRLLELECKKDQLRFQVECLNHLEAQRHCIAELSEKVDQLLLRSSEVDPTPLKRVMPSLESNADQSTVNTGGYHSEIDA